MEMLVLARKILVLMSFIGLASSLECVSCDWDVKNNTVDDNCLGAPFKTETIVCPKGNSPGERYMCQTDAQFDVKSGVMSLESLKRKCVLKHSRCNNACADDSPHCWMCCDDNDKCNSFPLRTNMVVISRAARNLNLMCATVVFVTLSIVLSFT